MTSPKPFFLSAVVLLSTAAVAQAAPSAPPSFTAKVFAAAPGHATFGPDDITALGTNVVVGWQNGIGPKGQAGPHHAVNSTVVEYRHSGKAAHMWSVPGKVDGLAASGSRIIATANEDGNSVLYVIKPGAAKKKQVVAYTYKPAPDAKGAGILHTGGGTDSVTLVGGQILVSASAPKHSGRAATFRVTLKTVTTKVKGVKTTTHVAALSSLFLDNSKATDALSGNSVTLHLTDPDSNAFVPISSGDTYAGDYVLNSQGGDQLVFASGLSGHPSLTRLPLSWASTGEKAGIDDVRWAPSDNATLYAVDNKANKIYKITGPFSAGDTVASMDTIGAKSAGGTIASLNDGSGELDPFITGLKAAKGLVFVG